MNFSPAPLPLLLALDDRPSRHRLLAQLHGAAHQLLHVYTAHEAIEYLRDESRQFALVCLDHALGHPHHTGMTAVEAVEALCEDPTHLARLRRARWRVHSLDYEAAAEMVHRLKLALGPDVVDPHDPLP